MNRPRFIRIVLVLGFLAYAVFRDKEPSYQGRKLSDWIGAVYAADVKFRAQNPGYAQDHATDLEWQTAGHAVKQMAPEAIPFLLRWAQADDSPLRQKLYGWLGRHPSFLFGTRNAAHRHDMAFYGFMLLGNEINSDKAVLVRLTYSADSRIRFWALVMLDGSHPDRDTFLPVLWRLLHDPDQHVQGLAKLDLHSLYPGRRSGGWHSLRAFRISCVPNQRDASTLK